MGILKWFKIPEEKVSGFALSHYVLTILLYMIVLLITLIYGIIYVNDWWNYLLGIENNGGLIKWTVVSSICSLHSYGNLYGLLIISILVAVSAAYIGIYSIYLYRYSYKEQKKTAEIYPDGALIPYFFTMLSIVVTTPLIAWMLAVFIYNF